MGREVRRVPVDSDWPLNKIWEGFLRPDSLDGEDCPDCKNGYSPRAENLYDLWYGEIPFDPTTTGSTPWGPDTPAIRARAERNIENASDYYGTGEAAIAREAHRLADHFNSGWMHHLNQDDVDALVEAGRLYDFTHTWTREDGWQPKEPSVRPTAAEVNEWSLSGMGHDGINAGVVIRARCEREGINDTCPTCQGHASVEAYPGQRAEAEAWEPTDTCPTCQGHASVEAYPGQRAEAEAWEPTDPPKGDGWQLWETVSEGSPISPVFATSDELAAWMSDPARGDRWVPPAAAAKFIADGWAPSFVGTPSTGLVSGVEWVGHHADDEK